MSKILIENVSALLDDGELKLAAGVEIAVEGHHIAAVGAAPGGFDSDQVIDGTGLLALPGLFNAHCHAAMSLQRGWAEDLPFERWLNERVWVAESALQEEDVYWGAALAACEMIRAGVVGFADHYFWMDQVARVVEESGLKALLAWCHFGLAPDQEVGGTTLDTCREFARRWHGKADGRVRVAMGPHSPYMCSPGVLRAMADAAEAEGVGLHLHLGESVEQLQVSQEKHGASPVAHLHNLGLLERDLLAAHCLVLADGDLELLARPNVTVAHTPKTYMKLGMAQATVGPLLQAGVNVALGSDGPASNSDLNLLEIMRLAGLREKQAQGDAAALPAPRLLRLASHAGANALGFRESGRLRPGARADLILLDTRGPHWAPPHDLLAGAVYASHPADVRHVMVDGRLLLRDGALQTLDEERIIAEASRRGLGLTGRRMDAMRIYRG